MFACISHIWTAFKDGGIVKVFDVLRDRVRDHSHASSLLESRLCSFIFYVFCLILLENVSASKYLYKNCKNLNWGFITGDDTNICMMPIAQFISFVVHISSLTYAEQIWYMFITVSTIEPRFNFNLTNTFTVTCIRCLRINQLNLGV